MDWSDFPGHSVVLETARLRLRPFQQDDFVVALGHYRSDPELWEAVEIDRRAVPSLAYVQAAGLHLASSGLLLCVETLADRRAIGEVCLQAVSKPQAPIRPGERVRRTPLALWDRTVWGQGLGGETLDRILAYAFFDERCDRLLAMDIRESNVRSRRLFESRGYGVVAGPRDAPLVQMELEREGYLRSRRPGAASPSRRG
jgi:RimJ/RimL family protein N-acetyltransferase